MARIRIAGSLLIVSLAAIAATAAPALATHSEGADAAAKKSRLCGAVNIPSRKKDARYYAHNVRCKKARRVAEWYVGTGPKVRGWVCSLSLGRCYEGDFGSRKYVRFPYHLTHPGQPIYRSSGSYKNCGTWWSGTVKAHNTSCRKARHLVKTFWRKSQRYGSPLTIDGFACKGRFHHDKYEVTCNKDGGKKLVRWRGGR